MDSLNEKLYRDIVDNLPGFVYQMRFRKDGTRYWSYINQAGAEMLGLQKDYTGTPDIAESAPQEDRKKLIESIITAVENLTVWDYEFKYRRPDGREIWLHCTGTPVMDGDEVALNGVLVDITEKKRTESRLRESEHKFNLAFSRTFYPIYITSMPGGVFIEVNEAFCATSGYTREELLGKSVLDFGFYTDQDQRKKLIDTLEKDGKLHDYRIGFRVKSGDTRECALYSTFIEVEGKPALLTSVTDLTEQVRSQNALSASEALYRSLFENASDGILLMKGLTFVECNPRALELFGCTETSQLVGKTPVDFSPENQPSGMKSTVLAQRMINRAGEGTPVSFEWLHSRLDGTTFFSEINLSHMAAGEDEFILAFVRDISHRKKIENELIDLQEYLQLQIENMPVAQIVWDTSFRAKGWNPAAEKIFGYNEEEVLGKNVLDLILPDDSKPEFGTAMLSVPGAAETVNNVFASKRKDGSVIICRWNNTPLRKRDGEIIGLLSMVQDITEQSRAEEELKTYQNYLEDLVRDRTTELEIANVNLEEREKSVRLLSEITSASNLSDDPGEAIYIAIERLAKHTGWEFGHMVYVDEESGSKVSSGIWYSSEKIKESGIEALLKDCTYSAPGCPVNMVIGSHEPFAVSHADPFGCEELDRMVKKMGLISSFAFPIEADKRIVGIIQFVFSGYLTPPDKYYQLARQIGVQLGMAVDRHRVGKELMLEKSRAEEASRTKSQFLANMSHEIRTPLNSILGFTDILSTKLLIPQNIKYLDSIRSSGKVLLQLLNDILDLSKVEAGQLEVLHSDIHISRFMEEIVSSYRERAESKGLKLHFTLSDKLPVVISTDELRLRQILINLLSNAVKFTNKGEVSIQAEAGRAYEGFSDIIFRVADTGIGISEDFRDKLFETFQQEDAGANRKYEGTGLGLAITRRLVETLGGKIEVQSRKGEGSIFTVILYNIKASDMAESKSGEHNLLPINVRFREGLVLLVEDNQDDCQYFKDLIESSGLRVVVAVDGKQALDRLSRGLRPSLIITDIRLPGIDGFEFVTRLRKNKALSEIPVVAISASAMIEDIEKIERYRFDLLLLKPVTMNEFYKGIGEFIESEIDPEIQNEPGLKGKIALTAKARQELPGLIDLLEGELSGDWSELMKKQPVAKVRSFAQKLVAAGESSEIDNLKEYGESILTSLESFDIESLKRDIKAFPDIINTLKLLE